MTLLPDSKWEAIIGEHPTTQTVVFEGSFNGTNWEPIKGQRLYGPGPKVGSVITNAVAGGPARFAGSAVGRKAIRVRVTRYDGVPIPVTLSSDGRQYAFTLGDLSTVMFIIEEEKSLEELLSEP